MTLYKSVYKYTNIKVSLTSISPHLCVICLQPHFLHWAGVQPRQQPPKPAIMDFDLCGNTAACIPALPLLKVSTSMVRVNTWIPTH